MDVTTAMDIFNKKYNEVERVIEHTPEMGNGTGYFDPLVKYPLPVGDEAKLYTGSKNDRKAILIGTRFGTVVVFQRYSGGEAGIVVSNTPLKVERLQLFRGGKAFNAEDTYFTLYGTDGSNLGSHIEVMAKSFE